MGRSAIQADFARQLADRNARAKPQKTFRSAAPKGTKLAAGYTDRTKDRIDEEEDEMAQRIKNLEEAMNLGEIDRPMFEKLVQEITGGDITSTHLVKGLDRKLLERVRKGEDVFGGSSREKEGDEPDVEDEFDELAEQEIGPIERQKMEKKGEMAPPKPVTGVKRSRNDLLAELKRQREEAAAAAAAEHEKKYPSLGAGFRKVNAPGTSRIEVDVKGREVLVVTDADGKEKRKIRKQKVEEPPPDICHDLDDENKLINVHNLPPPKPTEESEDEDIFEGVGSNYNPLANLDDDDESSEEEEGEKKPSEIAEPEADAEDSEQRQTREPEASESREEVANDQESTRRSSQPSTATERPPSKRDYFKNTSRTFAPNDTTTPAGSSTADATVRAALQKVRTLDPNSTLFNDPDSQEARLKKRAAELAARDRDMEDLDMGFGASRFDDAEEMEREGEKVKFSEWRGLGAEEDEEEGPEGRAGKKRKRGPKKKKGDKNSASDVLQAMARQKEKKALG